MRCPDFLILLLAIGFAGHPAWADTSPGEILPKSEGVIVVPANDPSISLEITCNNNKFNTMGPQSGMNDLLNKLQDFCKDQNKNILPDPGESIKPDNCLDYTITELNKAERPGRACKLPGGAWKIEK